MVLRKMRQAGSGKEIDGNDQSPKSESSLFISNVFEIVRIQGEELKG